MSRIIVVDEEDVPVGIMNRQEAREARLIWRASALWIFNTQGRILLAQRATQKMYGPGEWSASAAETLEEGETYDSNIIKESEEELGLTGITPIKGPKSFLRHEDGSGVFLQFYFLKLDRDTGLFRLQPEEVARVEWFWPQEISHHSAKGEKNWRYLHESWPAWSRLLKQEGYVL